MVRLAEVMSVSAAKISGLENQGQYLKAGSVANFALVDTNQTWRATAETQSKSTNNPYAGLDFKGRVIHTIYNGEFTVRNRIVREVEIDA